MEENLSENTTTKNKLNTLYNGLKKINPGMKRLFMSLYILGIGMLLFLLLDRYGLVEKFISYLAVYTGFYWLLVAMFLWVKDGFDKEKNKNV
jgi:hypothetical protein